MLYAIWAWDSADSLAKRQRVRPAHLARIERLKEAGRVVLAGPHPAIDGDEAGSAGFSGSLIVAEFANLDEARLWLEQDPYVVEGVFERYEIRPFKHVVP